MATAADLDIKMDATSLYREEIYTDRKIGTIRAMVLNGNFDSQLANASTEIRSRFQRT